MTNFSTNSGNGLDGISLLLASGKALLKSEITTATIADAATLTPFTTVHRISGTGAAATLAAIADGSVDGQWLCLVGNDNTNTVTINTGANTTLNGQVVLTLGDVIFLIWDATASVWQEVARNN
jgi:hypothetical protein